MFEKTPEQLFKKAIKYFLSATYAEDGLQTNDDHGKAQEICDKIFDILREKGDESKPEHHEGEYYFDNLTQKTHWLKGLLLAQHMYGPDLRDVGLAGPIIHFKSAMLEIDRAIQINPENKDMWIVKIILFNDWREMKRKEDDGNHPELLAEMTKCCDKVLSIDKDHLIAWSWKAWSTAELKRWEDELECENNVLRLDDRQEIQINTLLAKSFCLYKLGRLAESKKCCLEVQRLDPYNEMALERLHTLENQIPDNTGIEKNPASSQEASASCEKCGSALKPTAKFCGKCGTPIAYNAKI